MSVRKVISKFYGSCESFSVALNTNYSNGLDMRSHAEDVRARNFTGTASYSEADTLLLSGYTDGASKIQSECIRISQMPEVRTLRFTRRVAGFLPIVPLLLSGNPNCMLSRSKVVRQPSILRVYINVVVGASHSVDEIANAGAKILTAIREIEKRGIRIELNVGLIGAIYQHVKNNVFYGDCNLYSVFVRIKKSASPLNVLRAAYPIMHASFLRRHYFRFLESLPREDFSPKFENDLPAVCFSNKLPEQYKKDGVYIDLSSVIKSNFSVQDIVDIILKQK